MVLFSIQPAYWETVGNALPCPTVFVRALGYTYRAHLFSPLVPDAAEGFSDIPGHLCITMDRGQPASHQDKPAIPQVSANCRLW